MSLGYINALNKRYSFRLEISVLVIASFFILIFFPTSLFGPSFNVAMLIICYMVISFYRIKIDKVKPYLYFVVLFLILSIVKLSDFYFYENIRVSDYIRICFLLSCLFIVLSYNIIDKTKINFIVIFTILETGIVIGQIFSPELVGIFYNQDKLGDSSGSYDQFRFVGSLYNPNLLGFFMIFISSLFLTKKNRFIIYVTALFFVFVSGSRSSFIAISLAFVIYEFSCGYSLKKLLVYLTLVPIILVVFGFFLYIFEDEFYYFNQIVKVALDVLSGKGFSSFDQVSSLTGRFELWSNIFYAWCESGPVAWITGLPSLESYRYVDNSYIYILTKYGLVMGSMIFYCLYLIFYNIFIKIDSNNKRRTFLFFIGSVLICSIFSDILINYYFLGAVVTYNIFTNTDRAL
ncbi:O-antigen ligase family protein [Vibrio sp. RC27]